MENIFLSLVALGPPTTVSHMLANNTTMMLLEESVDKACSLSQTTRQFHFLCNFLPVTEEESHQFKPTLETTHNLRQSIKVSCIVSNMLLRSNRMRTVTHSKSTLNLNPSETLTGDDLLLWFALKPDRMFSKIIFFTDLFIQLFKHNPLLNFAPKR